MPTNPVLTARSMAEFIRGSSAKRQSILHAQKHPKEGAQVFKTPYYGAPLAGIRDYYRRGNSLAALITARSKIESISNVAKRANNHRVLDTFKKDRIQFPRKLSIQSNERHSASIASVLLKLSTDMQALDGSKKRFIYYHWKGNVLSPTVAQETLMIGYWVLAENDIDVAADALEYIDLFTGKVHRLHRKPIGVPDALLEASKIAASLWKDV